MPLPDEREATQNSCHAFLLHSTHLQGLFEALEQSELGALGQRFAALRAIGQGGVGVHVACFSVFHDKVLSPPNLSIASRLCASSQPLLYHMSLLNCGLQRTPSALPHLIHVSIQLPAFAGKPSASEVTTPQDLATRPRNNGGGPKLAFSSSDLSDSPFQTTCEASDEYSLLPVVHLVFIFKTSQSRPSCKTT
ncbi:uncharacterized protein BDR25DRAFT_304443 [Lindgomyces ingoldianus]|uniref:Uncharacterized protein n=1 Tax=Lindgomyces ingoldianus TaxID=673940 RepID=A0ACB6QT82_9PLEO|nr:uncharacterized protein BDR25DRAFT_304443 [Lindgomyces ingoldianus]KAF2469297.1 hypothetical protein BDR25DRAFT_304443 [Lindgomyces ingoldianus]